MAARGGSETQQQMIPRAAPGRSCQVCCDLGLGIIVVVALAFLVASVFRRDFSLLASAAWSFILFFPLLQVLFQRVASEDAEKEVKYQLSGNVVKEKAREELKATDTDLIGPVAAESSGVQTMVIVRTTATQWYTDNIDADWYRAGRFSFWFAILKAVLNIYSVMSTPIQYHMLTRDPDEPGWVGIAWVVSIEIPYMVLFLLPCFFYTYMQLRGWCTSRDPEGKSKAVVRLAGLLKSLGRFSALNLLEFIRIDDFIHQDSMQKVMSGIGAVIGFMAFRCKVSEIAFVVNQHILVWTLGQKIRVFALINNILSITDLRNKMIFASIQTKDYRADRWLEAVGDHLLDEEVQRRVRESIEENLSWPRLSAFLHLVNCCWHRSSAFFAVQRLVSMGPDDVNRVIEDLEIDYKSTGSRAPNDLESGTVNTEDQDPGYREHLPPQAQPAYGSSPKIPKRILDDCWNWQVTNVVGAVRFALFYVRARQENEMASQQKPECLQQGKVKRTQEEQLKGRGKMQTVIAQTKTLEQIKQEELDSYLRGQLAQVLNDKEKTEEKVNDLQNRLKTKEEENAKLLQEVLELQQRVFNVIPSSGR